MVRASGPPVESGTSGSLMGFLLVDTDVVSYLLNRHSLALDFERRLVESTPMISFMAIAEMHRGALKRQWGAKRQAELREHLSQFAVVPYSERVCVTYAEICTELEREGRPITTADAFIAASARFLRVPLLTFLASLDDTQPRRLVGSRQAGAYVPPVAGEENGHLLFLRETTLMAQAMDSRYELTGDPFPVAEQVGSNLALGYFSVSANGVLAYRSGGSGFGFVQLEWFDRQGKSLGTLGGCGSLH